MKKKNLKSLKLNKKSISKLGNTASGGATSTCPTFQILCPIILSVAGTTKPDCVNTWGDPTCPTGWDGLCVADNQ